MNWVVVAEIVGMVVLLAGIVFAFGVNYQKLDNMARDITEIKQTTGPIPAIQATLTHQHEWLERHDRDIHDLRKAAS